MIKPDAQFCPIEDRHTLRSQPIGIGETGRLAGNQRLQYDITTQQMLPQRQMHSGELDIVYAVPLQQPTGIQRFGLRNLLAPSYNPERINRLVSKGISQAVFHRILLLLATNDFIYHTF